MMRLQPKMNECSTTLITLTKETLIDIITGNKGWIYYDEFLNTWNSRRSGYHQRSRRMVSGISDGVSI